MIADGQTGKLSYDENCGFCEKDVLISPICSHELVKNWPMTCCQKMEWILDIFDEILE